MIRYVTACLMSSLVPGNKTLSQSDLAKTNICIYRYKTLLSSGVNETSGKYLGTLKDTLRP